MKILVFWEKYPDITKHVTSYENEQDYYDNIGYKDAEDANANMEQDWEDVLESYSYEQEVVIEEIKLEDDLIVGVKSKSQGGFITLEEFKNKGYTLKVV